MRKNTYLFPIVKIITGILVLLTIMGNLTACNKQAETVTQKPVTLLTTTSLNDSGLLEYLKLEFEKDTKIPLKIVAQGTGQAIKAGENGDGDVLFVHDRKSEDQFISQGFGKKRIEVMYNYFVIVGPKSDPAKIKDINGNASVAFKQIMDTNSKFASRGDNSGTHSKEKSIWSAVNIQPSGDWYMSVGKGMGDTLKMASELGAYTLSDKSTFLSMKDNIDLEIALKNSKDMLNQYTIIAVNDAKQPNINAKGAQELIKWMTSEKALNMIKDYGKDKYGEALFTVNFKSNE